MDNSSKGLIQCIPSTEEPSAYVTKTLRIRSDDNARKTLAKKRHDLENALETFQLALDSIKKGYRFEDAAGPTKIQYLELSLKTLREEVEFLKNILTL